jgi:4-nitrophenyl phosphatase
MPVHVGDVGSGAAAKLVANAALFDTLSALGETIALAEGFGLSREVTYQILARTPLAAQAERRRPAIEANDYPPRFRLALARKDAALIQESAAAAGVDLRLTAAAASWLTDAASAGLGDQDYTAVLETILGKTNRSGSAPRRALRESVRTGRLAADGLIVDLDGVIWRGDNPIEGAADAIAAVRAKGVRVLFLTNEPRRPRATIAARLTQMGIPATESEVMTSASAVARMVADLGEPGSRRVLVIGPPALHHEVKNNGLQIIPPEAAEEAEVVVVGGHEHFDYRELHAATTALRNGARLFATGRDAVFPDAVGVRPATGAILAAVETAGGTSAVVVGKPERLMFDIARDVLAGCRRLVAIGDHLITDVAGAKRAGIPSILVLTGVATRADIDQADILPDLVLDSIADLPDAFDVGWDAHARGTLNSVLPNALPGSGVIQ